MCRGGRLFVATGVGRRRVAYGSVVETLVDLREMTGPQEGAARSQERRGRLKAESCPALLRGAPVGRLSPNGRCRSRTDRDHDAASHPQICTQPLLSDRTFNPEFTSFFLHNLAAKRKADRMG